MINTSQNRKRYDSFLTYLYSSNKEHIIPENIRKEIPHSTASTWRKTDCNSFYGKELREIQQESLDWYELFARYQKLKCTIMVLIRVWISLSDYILPVLHKTKKYSEQYIDGIQQLTTVLPKKLVLKLAGISSSSYYAKLNRLKFQCLGSDLFLCRKNTHFN